MPLWALVSISYQILILNKNVKLLIISYVKQVDGLLSGDFGLSKLCFVNLDNLASEAVEHLVNVDRNLVRVRALLLVCVRSVVGLLHQDGAILDLLL